MAKFRLLEDPLQSHILSKNCKIQAQRRLPTKPHFVNRWQNSGSQEIPYKAIFCQQIAKFRLPGDLRQSHILSTDGKIQAAGRPPKKPHVVKDSKIQAHRRPPTKPHFVNKATSYKLSLFAKRQSPRKPTRKKNRNRAPLAQWLNRHPRTLRQRSGGWTPTAAGSG